MWASNNREPTWSPPGAILIGDQSSLGSSAGGSDILLDKFQSEPFAQGGHNWKGPGQLSGQPGLTKLT